MTAGGCKVPSKPVLACCSVDDKDCNQDGQCREAHMWYAFSVTVVIQNYTQQLSILALMVVSPSRP